MKLMILVLITMIMWLPVKVNGAAKILLVPLDSRPFCTKTVADSARIASTEVILPPHSMLDFFTIAGEPDQLRRWTLQHISEAEAAILSIDQLTAGGLIASRETVISDGEIDGLTNFLIELRLKAPSKKIYAFSILPRHLPPSTIENYHQRQALTIYSRLLSAGREESEALIELEKFIAPSNKRLYFDRFIQSERLNRRLIELTKAGILDRLIIGSDDSERRSFQNVIASRLTKLIEGDRISLTHGADELAMTLLARHITDGRRLRVMVEYNEPSAAYRIMPFMSATVGTVVVEKIGIMGGVIVDRDADFTLLVSVNDGDKKSRRSRRLLADEISKRIARGERIALVDLSVHFDRDETLMPVLIERGVAVNGLLAYSSFNTASNAIGCALSEAAVTLSALQFGDGEEVLRRNIEFLTGRVIEDEFYLKEAIDSVNNSLRRAGREPAFLDAGAEFDWATSVLRLVMAAKVERYERSKSFRLPVTFVTADDLITLRAERIEASYRFPWYRTFEIELKLLIPPAHPTKLRFAIKG